MSQQSTDQKVGRVRSEVCISAPEALSARAALVLGLAKNSSPAFPSRPVSQRLAEHSSLTCSSLPWLLQHSLFLLTSSIIPAPQTSHSPVSPQGPQPPLNSHMMVLFCGEPLPCGQQELTTRWETTLEGKTLQGQVTWSLSWDLWSRPTISATHIWELEVGGSQVQRLIEQE